MAWYRCIGGSSSPAPSSGDFKKCYYGTLIANSYISDTDGHLITNYNNWSSTDYIPIEGSELYFIGGVAIYTNNKYNAFYDEDKIYISRLVPNNPPTAVPNNAKYIRLSSPSQHISQDNYFFMGTES